MFIQTFSEVWTLEYWEPLENIYSELYAELEPASQFTGLELSYNGKSKLRNNSFGIYLKILLKMRVTHRHIYFSNFSATNEWIFIKFEKYVNFEPHLLLNQMTCKLKELLGNLLFPL